ncbi:biotin--[acetyl-CoA-carboxylase] ligase [Crenalkalicoccus roseus]|uniref:biotin--[acetyl-CoA-carboxylase] ligase n=1 Tax=Crenalkalicoccus roseus TaxID=1485588 RepID=UPI0010800AAF|nr:biotin--[acetyl-CoA-carboxylase] ligase [Crenalkalicoccus roseus]
MFDTLPSTSDWLIQQAERGASEGLAVLAKRQTAGRGRNGRQWASPQGNLYLSVLLRPAGTAREAGQWALLAGVALFEAAAALVGAQALRLKWPNDLLHQDAKAGGILAESALARDDGPQGRLAWLVLGIGVNLAAAPALPDRPTTMLGGGEAPEAFAARLLARLDHWRRVQAAQGFAPLRAAWEAAGPRRGTALTVRVGEGSIAGRYAALAEDGSLLLETEQGLRRITAGEVAAMEVR